MKRGTPRHPKILHFAAVLKVPKYSAVGLLEMLWHFTAEFAVDGGIGKHSDDAITQAMSWDGPAHLLIEALCKSGWIDRCTCHRLRVHDWKDHADQTVQRVLAARHMVFLPCYDDASIVLAPSEQPDSTPPALTDQSTVKPERKPASKPAAYSEDFARFWNAYPRKIGKLKAASAWNHAKRNGLPIIDMILTAIERAINSDDWKKDGGKFIPHPSTWLNQGRWEDGITGTEPAPPPERDEAYEEYVHAMNTFQYVGKNEEDMTPEERLKYGIRE